MNNNLPSEAIVRAVALLNNEHVIAYPTEAVFGVGCDPDSEKAVRSLLALKQRPVEKGLILIAANFEQLKPYIDDTQLSDEQLETIFFLLARACDICLPRLRFNAALVDGALQFTGCASHGSSAGGRTV